MKIQSIRGGKDILPGEIEKWQWVEKVAHRVFKRYGFQEIRLPIFEKTALFSRSIGETTDIVEKEMYTFTDRSDEQITLRPEGTASVVRAYVEHKLYNPPSVLKLFYMGPMFRYERPQKGRQRQFYQIGIEAMGTDNPVIDFEVMTLLLEFFKELGLEDLKLQLNSLGCKECRPAYREILQREIEKHLGDLCENCNQRYQKNPLRVLDCKVERDHEIAKTLPKTKDHLCATCDENFSQVLAMLDQVNAPYAIDPQLVRGLDYYSRTTFEVTSSGLGAQNAICGGGRYDALVEELDGPPTPCFGFALGMERLVSLITLPEAESNNDRPDVFVVALGSEAQQKSLPLIHDLRNAGVSVESDYAGASMKSQMKKANKSGSKTALILGENEIRSGQYQLKNMATSEQVEVSSQEIIASLQALLAGPTSSPEG